MKHTTLHHRLLTAVWLLVAAVLVTVADVSPAHANAGFNTPAGVAVDRQGDIFVADKGTGRVVELSPRGRVLRAWQAACDHGTGGRPIGLALDRLGNVYVTDPAHNCLLKYSSRGRLLAQFGTSGDGEFLHPWGAAVGGRGNIFVANMDKHSIEKLSPSGYVLATWETHSSDGSGVSLAPQDIALDAAGNIYTVVFEPSGDDYVEGSYAVQKRSSNGELLAGWTGLSAPGDPLSGLAVGGRGNVFVGNLGQGDIIKLSPDGQRLADWHTENLIDLSDLYAIAVDRRDNLYVAGGDTGLVVKLSSAGRELAAWDGSGR
jgi:DNA-binding beta-propeller fold protein YncE